MDDRLRQFQMKFQQGMGSRGPNYPGGFVDLTLRLGLPYNSDANLMTQIGHSDQLVANRPPQVQATPFNYFDASHDQGMQYGCVNMNNASDNYAGPINYLEKYNRIGIFVGQKSDGTSSEGVSESISSAPNSYGTNPYKTMAFSSAPQIKDYVLPNPSTTYNSTTGAQKGVGGSNTSRKNKKKNVTASENDQDDKRCSNLNCGTNSTPMWRKGPLGPKSLCNACGIKYRKQEEKRAAMEAAEEANY